ncbi:hypothetical protein [Thermus oshimai]
MIRGWHLEALLGLSPKEVLALLRRLMGEGRVLREGRGPGTRYRRA